MVVRLGLKVPKATLKVVVVSVVDIVEVVVLAVVVVVVVVVVGAADPLCIKYGTPCKNNSKSHYLAQFPIESFARNPLTCEAAFDEGHVVERGNLFGA